MSQPFSREPATLLPAVLTLLSAMAFVLSTGAPANAQLGGPFGVDINRRYDQNSFIATHDSFANIDGGYAANFANHHGSLTKQLDRGVRVLSLRCYTMKQWKIASTYYYQFQDGDKWVEFAYNPPANIDTDVYLAHSPELGYINVGPHQGWGKLDTAINEIADWSDAHPDQLITLSISDRTRTENASSINHLNSSRLYNHLFWADYKNINFFVAGLTPWEVSKHGWPLVGSLLGHGKRVVVSFDNGPEEPAYNSGAMNSDSLYERRSWRSRRDANGDDPGHADDTPPAVDWNKKLFALTLKPYVIAFGPDHNGINLPTAGSPNFYTLNSQENLVRKISLLRFHNYGRIPNWLVLDGSDHGDDDGPASAARHMNALWARRTRTRIPTLMPVWERSKVWGNDPEKYFVLGYDTRVAKLGNYLFAGANGRLVQFDATTGAKVASYGDLAIASLKSGEVQLSTQPNLPYLFVSNRRWVYRFDLGSDGRLHKVWEHELSFQFGQYQITRAMLLPYSGWLYVGYSGILYRLRKGDGGESGVAHLRGGGWGPVELGMSRGSTTDIYAGVGGKVFKLDARASSMDNSTVSVGLSGRGSGDTVTLTSFYDRTTRQDVVFAGSNGRIFKIYNNDSGGISSAPSEAFPGDNYVSLANDGISTVFAASGGDVAAVNRNGNRLWHTVLPKGTGEKEVNIGYTKPQFGVGRLFAGCQSYLFDMDVNDGFINNTTPLQDGSWVQDDSYSDTIGVVRTWGVWPGYDANDVHLSFSTSTDGVPMVFAGVNGMAFGMRLDSDDRIPPQTSISYPAPDGYNGWYRNPVTVSLSATDDIGELPPSYPTKTFYQVDGQTYKLYVRPFTVSGDGIHTIQYFSDDRIGNTEAVQTRQIRIDSTPPTTRIVITKPTGSNTRTIQLPATDNVSGALYTFYRLNGGAWVDELGLGNPGITLTPGFYHLEVYSQDDAGNNEVTQDKVFFFGPINVTPAVQVTRGVLRYERATDLWKQDVTLTNNSGLPVNNPLSMVVGGLPSGVTLNNKTGVTVLTTPKGQPYINVPDLAAGETKQVTLAFKKTNAAAQITYTPTFYAYEGDR